MAWAVPTVAVAATVPMAAASPVLPPVVNWTGGCMTVGNGECGCNGVKFTGQVPVSLYNSTNAPLVFQVISGAGRISGSSTWTDGFSVWTNTGSTTPCSQIVTTGCGGYISITVAAGATANIWIVSANLGNASDYDLTFTYRWIAPCAPNETPVIKAGPETVVNPNPIPSNNCCKTTTTTTAAPTTTVAPQTTAAAQTTVAPQQTDLSQESPTTTEQP